MLKVIRQVSNQPDMAEIISAEWAAETAAKHGQRILDFVGALKDGTAADPEKAVRGIEDSLGILIRSLTMRGMLADEDALLQEIFGKIPVEIVEVNV